jgi:c-di-GMP-related signal transduction protein
VDVLVARQPIFNRRAQLHGYALRYGPLPNGLPEPPLGDQATMRLVAESFFLLGIEAVTAGKCAYITFSRDTIVGGYPALLPRELIAVELPAATPVDPELLGTCQRLRQLGYPLVLTDTELGQVEGPLGLLASVLKVDFKRTDPAERAALGQAAARRGTSLGATGIDTQADFRAALQSNFSLVQGQFFCQPDLVAGRAIPSSSLRHLELLAEVNRAEIDLTRLEAVVRHEVSFAYKLLRFVNSAAFGLRRPVESLRRALLFLGETGARQWASIVVLAELSSSKPSELIVQAAVRARFCELLAGRTALAHRRQDLFLMGLFSLLDAILDQSLDDALAETALAPDARRALLGEANPARQVLDCVLAYEQGDWSGLEQQAANLGLSLPDLPPLYQDSLAWANAVGAA